MGKDGIRELSGASVLGTSSGAGGGRPWLGATHIFRCLLLWDSHSFQIAQAGDLAGSVSTRATSVAYLASSPVL